MNLPILASEKAWWIFALLSAFFAALTTIFAKVGVEGVNSNLATAIRTVVILAIAWGIAWQGGQLSKLGTIAPKTWIFLILSGIATGLSWLCYFKALQIGSASLVAPIDKSGVVLVLILSALFLGESLSYQAVIGTALIVAGTLFLIKA
ncbi:MAG: EamA family transporter [Cyanobacteria bacterium P01_F01_bin.153]